MGLALFPATAASVVFFVHQVATASSSIIIIIIIPTLLLLLTLLFPDITQRRRQHFLLIVCFSLIPSSLSCDSFYPRSETPFAFLAFFSFIFLLSSHYSSPLYPPFIYLFHFPLSLLYTLIFPLFATLPFHYSFCLSRFLTLLLYFPSPYLFYALSPSSTLTLISLPFHLSSSSHPASSHSNNSVHISVAIKQ